MQTGTNTVDRIPHNQMLARYSYVDPETGKYREPENRAVVYGSLTHVRLNYLHQYRPILPYFHACN